MTSQFDLTRFYDVIIRNSVFQLGFLTREFQIPLSTTNFWYFIFIKRYFKRKQQFLQYAISLVKLLFSSHPGNQFFIYHVYIFLLWISWIIRIFSTWCFALFSIYFWIVCVTFVLRLPAFERSSHRRCSMKKMFLKFCKIDSKAPVSEPCL